MLEENQETNLEVVGVGASAGGLDALSRLFAPMAADLPVAFCVVQHLSPNHRSLMPELLERRTALRVELATDGCVMAPGTVYLMPGGAELRVEGQVIRLQGGDDGERHALPVDTLLESLATDRGGRALAIILSGTGSDGSKGAALIREAGGTVIVQDPTSSQFDGMPRSVVERGLATHVVLPELIGELLKERIGRLRSQDDLEQIIVEVRKQVGIDLGEYKRSTLLRRLSRRMEDSQQAGLGAYLQYLRSTRAEADKLLGSLFIEVTSFFRDPAVFEQLENDVLPALVANGHGELRIWSAGCATGPEAYSLAMAAIEACERMGTDRSIKIFATDANESAIARAKRGRYPVSALEGVSPERLERWFEPADDGHRRVSDSLRRHILFATQNLQVDPPFSQLDMVSCRNVLIYFRPELQRRLMSLFHFALKPQGVLMLGDSETPGELTHAFEALGDRRRRIYQRLDRPSSRAPLRTLPALVATRARVERSSNVALAKEALLDAHAPAAALVDGSGEIEHLFGDTSAFLSLPTGAMSSRIDRLARGPLAAVITTLLARVGREKITIQYPPVELTADEPPVVVRATPVDGTASILLTFERAAARSAVPLTQEGHAGVEDLHRELLHTRENLQVTIEELQASNEELQASSEEMLAANEELQATNEELHATNEELHTVSTERQDRIDELVELNEDIENLQRSVDFAAVFLDGDLQIRRAVGAANRFLKILPRDVRRPIGHFAHPFEGIDLEAVCREVLESKEPARHDQRVSDGTHLVLRVLPYRSTEQGERGVVLSVGDVTDVKAMEAKLQTALDSLPQEVAVIDLEGRITHVNGRWRDFGAAQGGAETLGSNYLLATRQDPDAQGISEGLEHVLRGESDLFTTEYPCHTPEGERYFLMHATPMRLYGSQTGAVVSHLDITERHHTARRLEEASDLAAALLEQVSQPLALVDANTLVILEVNPAAERALAREAGKLVGAPLSLIGLEGTEEEWRAAVMAALKKNEPVSRVVGVLTGDGESSAESVMFAPVDGARVMVMFEGATLASSSRSQRLEALGTLAGGVAHELNNVLAAVLGVVESWSGTEFSDQHRQDLEDVTAACHRGRDVTRNLLGFARVDGVPTLLAIDEVIEEVGRLLQRAAPTDVRVVIDTRSKATVRADRGLLAQALLNLGLNSVAAIGERGTVRITSLLEEESGGDQPVLVTVEDDGSGMESAIQARMFEPFFTTKPLGQGTGLGLPMVHGFVRSMSGFLDVRSTVGEGTRIAISLPTAEEEPAEDSDEPIPRLDAHVLVVDDDPLVRRALVRSLTRLGAEVSEATDGRSALSQLSGISAVVLDVMMPGMDGFATLSAIRAEHPTLPVVMHSGYPAQTRADLADHEYTDFVYKPVDRGTLARTITRLLDG